MAGVLKNTDGGGGLNTTSGRGQVGAVSIEGVTSGKDLVLEELRAEEAA